jgi:UDP-2,3-diacylglucosamine hydrolase
MAHLFIADLHLCEQEPAITAGFLNFLQQHTIDAEALYILGDFFEIWIGDDDTNPLHQQIANALSQLHQRNVKIYFIHGNRDFLLGKTFAKQCQMMLLPETTPLNLYGKKIVIMHGDTLCTDDRSYQKLRKRVHNPLIQWMFLLLPLRWRLNIAKKMRSGSQRSQQNKSMSIMDVNQQAVINTMQQTQAEWLIHGHTHRPAIHDVPLGKGYGKRAVLGAWHQQGSMIKVSQQGMELLQFPFSSADYTT